MGTDKSVGTRAQDKGFPVAMAKPTNQRKRAQKRKNELWEPLIHKRDRCDDGKVLEGFFSYGWVAMHRIEQCHVGQHSGIIHLRGSNQDITEETREAISDHLGS